VTRLHHVNVVVPPGRTPEVVHFYVEVLRLTRVPKEPAAGSPDSGAWLQIGPDTQLHLSERDGEVNPDAHFALLVEDFDEALRRLADAGAPWTDQPFALGGRRGFTRDPVGNRVELIEATAADS
jgi:catechol 2,3-dioxygenase-like lactoylglutathione lyase family enzyme